MHDLDRTTLEADFDDVESDEPEMEFEDEDDLVDSDADSPFDEAEEMELASELLNVTDDEELEYFLGSLIKKATRRARKFIKSKARRHLGGLLRRVARKALPIAGGAIGGFFGGPAGSALGSRFASFAGKRFGLELEGLSPEDQEFEVARSFVRFAGAAAQKAAAAPESVPAVKAANAAVADAARKHAPGLIRGGMSSALTPPSGGRSGRWVRRGRRIVLLGV